MFLFEINFMFRSNNGQNIFTCINRRIDLKRKVRKVIVNLFIQQCYTKCVLSIFYGLYLTCDFSVIVIVRHIFCLLIENMELTELSFHLSNKLLQHSSMSKNVWIDTDILNLFSVIQTRRKNQIRKHFCHFFQQ